MLIVLAAVVVIGLRMPADSACVLQEAFFPAGVIRAAAYGGFNAALLLPVMDSAQSYAPRQRKRAIVYAGLIFACLVMAANAVILRHPRLLAEPLPFVRLLNSAGKSGFLLCAAGLYLAVLSTLTACFRGLGRHWYTPVGIAAVALLGFNGVVEVAYPLAGGGCLCMLAAAKFVNCFRKPFQSPGDML